MQFDTFLMAMYPGARARNDTEWLEWYEEWRAGMPEDDREGYLERSKAEYERRIGMSIDEYMDQWFKAYLAESLDEDAAANRAKSLDERIAANSDEILDEILAANSDEILDEIAAANREDATNHQIMVENFKVFEREYFGMMASRSC